MNRSDIYARLKEVFADVFDAEIDLYDSTTAADVEEWDSLTHINLLAAVEDEFDVKFDMKVVQGLKNVGEMVDIIETQVKN